MEISKSLDLKFDFFRLFVAKKSHSRYLNLLGVSRHLKQKNRFFNFLFLILKQKQIFRIFCFKPVSVSCFKQILPVSVAPPVVHTFYKTLSIANF